MFSNPVSKLFALSLLASAASASPGVLARQAFPSCNRDNCFRAVAGTRSGVPASNTADCSSFFSITATSCPTAATVTSVTTSVSTSNTYPTGFDSSPQKRTVAKRQNSACTPTTVRPTSVPGYATACSGTARYSSACSCLIGPNEKTMTTTVVPPASTTVSTVAATTTVRGQVNAQFRVSSGGSGFIYVNTAGGVDARQDIVTGFNIDRQGRLVSQNFNDLTDQYVYVNPDNTLQQGYARLGSYSTPPAGAYILNCVLSNGQSGQLLCRANVGGIILTNFYLFGGQVYFGNSAPPQGSLITIVTR